MEQRSARDQANPKKTDLALETADGQSHKLWEYRYPEVNGRKFLLFLDKVQTEAARTEGKSKTKGKVAEVRHYTYIKLGGRSLYVQAWLEENSHVQVRRAQ